MTYGHVVKAETFMLGHMDCIIFSGACLLFHWLGGSTWCSREARVQEVWQEDPVLPQLAGSQRSLWKKSLIRLVVVWVVVPSDFEMLVTSRAKNSQQGPGSYVIFWKGFLGSCCATTHSLKFTFREKSKTFPVYRYITRTRAQWPACSDIYFDPFNGQVKSLVILDLAKIVSRFSEKKCLKDPQKGSRGFLDIKLLVQNIFDESSINTPDT